MPLFATADTSRFLTFFEIIWIYYIYDPVYSYLKLKLKHSQHDFTKSNSTTTSLVTNLEYITPLVGSECQAVAFYFDLTSDFDLIPHTLLLDKSSSLGFSGCYVNWFHSYLTNRQPQVHISGTVSSPFQLLSGVPQGSVLGPLLFKAYINDLRDTIKHYSYLLRGDDIKIYRAINSLMTVLFCNLIYSIWGWCVAKYFKLNIDRTLGKQTSWSTSVNLSIHYNPYWLF